MHSKLVCFCLVKLSFPFLHKYFININSICKKALTFILRVCLSFVSFVRKDLKRLKDTKSATMNIFRKILFSF